jgi:hypothetical protein
LAIATRRRDAGLAELGCDGPHSRLSLAGRFTVPGVAGIFSLVAGPMGHGCPL